MQGKQSRACPRVRLSCMANPRTPCMELIEMPVTHVTADQLDETLRRLQRAGERIVCVRSEPLGFEIVTEPVEKIETR